MVDWDSFGIRRYNLVAGSELTGVNAVHYLSTFIAGEVETEKPLALAFSEDST